MTLDMFANDNPEISKPIELLPYDGSALYYGTIISAEDANTLFQQLLDTVAWQHDEAIIFGKHITTKRKVAWYGDQDFSYTYSNTTKTALPWNSALLRLKEIVEQSSQESYNSCLLNLYHDGSEGMAWHSDAEKDLIENGAIASLSLGATRKFSFKHKHSKEVKSVELYHGSLLVMKDTTQTHWQHSLPPTKKVSTARINLTFRTIRT